MPSRSLLRRLACMYMIMRVTDHVGIPAATTEVMQDTKSLQCRKIPLAEGHHLPVEHFVIVKKNPVHK